VAPKFEISKNGDKGWEEEANWLDRVIIVTFEADKCENFNKDW
jgi:hypothetical protein